MANQRKTYFLADNFNWPAENGPVKLGSIISSRSTPHEPKNSSPFSLPDDVYETYQLKWEDAKNKHNDGTVGIWARFIDGIGPKVEASGGWGNLKSEKYQFDKMVWRYFVPDEDYIEKRMNDAKLQNFLTTHKKPVYMITGLMIAYNPKASSVFGKKFKVHGDVGVDVAGVAQVGPKVDVSTGAGSKTSFKGGSDFVFAFQLKAIWYKVVKKNRVLLSKDETKGALYNADREDGPPSDSTKLEDLLEVAELLSLSEGELTAQEAGIRDEEVQEVVDDVDGKVCQVGLFNA